MEEVIVFEEFSYNHLSKPDWYDVDLNLEYKCLFKDCMKQWEKLDKDGRLPPFLSKFFRESVIGSYVLDE